MSTKNPLWNRNPAEAEISGSEGRRCLPGVKKIEFVEKTTTGSALRVTNEPPRVKKALIEPQCGGIVVYLDR